MRRERTFATDTYVCHLRTGKQVDKFIAPSMREHTGGLCAYISFRRQDRGTDVPWTDKQAIKDQLVGEHREAIEIFPATSRLIDAANHYHLWVMPEGAQVPFGFGYEDQP